MNKMEGTSLNFETMNVEKIKELFPNVVTEGKIDFDKLRVVLGDEIDDRVEKYQFTWNGKSSTIKLAQSPSTGTLIPSKEDSKNWDSTENLYIEGDNFEVLKQLQKTYYGKIKMIYIDPPYNTGGDFVYKDDFKDNIKNYKEQTQQTTRANPETNGRYHTDWLNMMYSRLILAKNLLSDDGVIFISIDDHEHSNLQSLCNEIFGENNFVGCISRATGTTTGQDANKMGSSLDYCLLYSKGESFVLKGLDLSDEDAKRFNDEDSRGKYSMLQLRKTGNADTREDRPSMFYPVTAPDGQDVYPFGPTNYLSRWRVGSNTYSQLLEDNMIVWKQAKQNEVIIVDGVQRSEWTPYVKYYLEGRTKQVSNLMIDIEGNKKGSIQLKELFGNKGIFDNPKPLEFLSILLRISTHSNSVILDFFAGSSTTAHAVMQLNAEDGGNRKFIMVQLPELTDESSEAFKAGYKNICEIGKERIRRAGEQIKQELIDKKNKAGLLVDNVVDPDSFDNGFKVFKLESTNIIPWDGTIKLDETTIFTQSEVIKDDRSDLDVLYEIMLKYGVFDKPVQEIKINGKTMYSVSLGYLIVCLDNNITLDDVKEIGKLKPHNVIFKESGFANDNDKINATYTLEKLGVEEIKSI